MISRVPLEPFSYGGGCDGPLTVIGNLGKILCSSPGLSSQVVPGGWSCPINPNQRVADKLCLLFNLNLGVSPYLLWPRAGP
jgi:hypothetical protein